MDGNWIFDPSKINDGNNNILDLPNKNLEGDDFYCNFCIPRKIFIKYSQRLAARYKFSLFEYYEKEGVIVIIRENEN